MADAGVLIAYAAIGAMALAPIYTGSQASLGRVPGGTKHETRVQFPEYSDSEDEEESESLSSEDAYWMPVYGSATLLTLFVVLKYLKSEWITLLLSAYVALVGVAAATQATVCATKRLTAIKLPLFHVHLAHRAKTMAHLQFTVLHLAAGAGAVALTTFYLWTRNWVASNALGLAASFSAIALLRLDSFKTGMIMLAGLFAYDVFWVFGTPVMVTVAKGFDAPIKVVFPRALFPATGALKFTMLGLGDIVIPGIFLALALRFDRQRYLDSIGFRKDKPLPRALNGHRRGFAFPMPYFTACGAAYVAGLATTITVMHVFKAAQPALLYLSPACILAVLGTALARGELQAVLAYSEEQPKGDDADKESNAHAEEPAPPRYNLRNHASPAPGLTTPSSAGELADDEQEGVKARHVLDEKVSPIAGTDSSPPPTPSKAARAKKAAKAKSKAKK
ncbi:hypothetical protein H4R19_001852 [Coemansia spiralis]|nr:hypothetical protein H4R19_001852 [Coemansia spiralis]